MKLFAQVLAVSAVMASPLIAQQVNPISAMIGEKGLAAAEAELAAISVPDATQSFALGGVRFLRGVENALQTRWDHNTAPSLDYIPILRLLLPQNSDPTPANPAMVEEIFQRTLSDMTRAADALAAIPDGADPGLVIDLNDLWFDLNSNGTREPFEGLMEIALDTPPGMEAEEPSTIVRFDAADVAWLQAYTHLISGASELVLAFDTTSVIEKVEAASARASEMQMGRLRFRAYLDIDELRWLDLAAIQIQVLRQQPDAERTRSARQHLLKMVAANRVFWARVAEETDNEAEWIPADGQDAALGFELPDGAGPTWVAVLDDVEAMLNGELLIPHWRYSNAYGIDVAKFLDDPAPLDLLGWVHGMDALDYMKPGPVISGQSWQAFEQLIGRRGMLFALLLN
ncbi:hypothetical protein [Halovulum sp. GXIMD14793]